jgi:antitoxin FitA
MSVVQIRDLPEATVSALKAKASAEGMSLSAFLRRELQDLAARPSNAEVVERLARRQRDGGPSHAQTVAEIRKLRAGS